MSLNQAGQRWLRLLAKHEATILAAYCSPGSHISETPDNAGAVEELIVNRIAFRRDDTRTVRLSSSLRKAMDYALGTHKLYVVDAYVAENLQEVCRLGTAYKECRLKSLQESTQVLDELEDIVYSLCEGLKESSRQIWRHIETKFGGVTTLDMKVKLNQLTLERAEKITKSIELIEMESLFEISGTDPDLRRLFNLQLATALDYALRDMSDAFSRLHKMLFDLKELQAKARLVQRFIRHFQAKRDYELPAYDEAAQVPLLFRRPDPLELSGYAPVTASRHEAVLENYLTGLRAESPLPEMATINPVPVDGTEPAVAQHEDSPIRRLIRELYSKALMDGKPISAMTAYAEMNFDEEPDIWLYAIIAEYESFSSNEQEAFLLDYAGSPDAIFDGNFKATDIMIWPR